MNYNFNTYVNDNTFHLFYQLGIILSFGMKINPLKNKLVSTLTILKCVFNYLKFNYFKLI